MSSCMGGSNTLPCTIIFLSMSLQVHYVSTSLTTSVMGNCGAGYCRSDDLNYFILMSRPSMFPLISMPSGLVIYYRNIHTKKTLHN